MLILSQNAFSNIFKNQSFLWTRYYEDNECTGLNKVDIFSFNINVQSVGRYIIASFDYCCAWGKNFLYESPYCHVLCPTKQEKHLAFYFFISGILYAIE